MAPAKEVSNRDLVVWVLGALSSVAGAVVLIGGTAWLSHVDRAIAEQAKTAAVQEKRLTIVENDLRHLVGGVERLERKQEESSKLLRELKEGQDRWGAAVSRQLPDRGEGGNAVDPR